MSESEGPYRVEQTMHGNYGITGYPTNPDGYFAVRDNFSDAMVLAQHLNSAHAAALASSKPSAAFVAMRTFIEKVADMENPEHYGNARDALHAVKLEAAEIVAALALAEKEAGK